MMENRTMYIRLVLPGGMGKGAYQVDALTAIDEFFNPSEFEYVSATSIGPMSILWTKKVERLCSFF